MHLVERSRNTLKNSYILVRLKLKLLTETVLNNDKAIKANSLNSQIIGRGKRKLTVGEVPGWLPDANDQMLSITGQAAIMCAAVESCNWELADHAYRAMVKRLKAFSAYRSTSHPKQTELTEGLIEWWCGPLKTAISHQSLTEFQQSWKNFLDQVNTRHKIAGFGYIQLSSVMTQPAWILNP